MSAMELFTTETEELSFGERVLQAALFTLLPSVVMFLGSVVAFVGMGNNSDKVLSCTQYFSAGLLIAAVASELVPRLTDERMSHLTFLCVTVGFFAGLGALLLTERFMEAHEVSEESEDEDKESPLLQAKTASGAALWKRAKLKISAVSGLASVGSKRVGHNASSAILNYKHSEALRAKGIVKPMPWKACIPIYMDSLIDGLLIGIVLTVSWHAGATMTLATTFEMGFLGLTFGAMLRACGTKRWIGAVAAPVILWLGGIIGGTCAGFLKESTTIFPGIVAFGTAALLFLVVNELLSEARENMGEEEDWRLSSCFFLGFFFILLSDHVFI